MNSQVRPLAIRPASADDTGGMRTLLNEIIRVGGTTAITNELSPDVMREWRSGSVCQDNKPRELSETMAG